MFYLINKNTEEVIQEIEGKIKKVQKNLMETYSENGTLLIQEVTILDELEGFTSLEEIMYNPTGFFPEYDEMIHAITVDKPKTLEQLKELKIEEFQALREQKLVENITIDDIELQVRSLDRENIQEAVKYGLMEQDNIRVENPDYVMTLDWIAADNSTVSLNLEELENYIKFYVARKMQVFAEYGEVLSAIEGAENKEELNTIKWEV